MMVVLGWLVTIFFLWLYSLTQIDLGLTLVRFSFWQVLQKSFQSIGYFHRPLSSFLYLGLLFLLFTFYFLLLIRVKQNQLSLKQVWLLILITAGLLCFSYNAFSHDLFNYLFDAKIIAFYGSNPYQSKPLDFPDDPMLGFMHWTHRPSVYPPLWIGLSIIPFVLGMGKLVLQMINFKLMIAGFYLGTSYLIWKISQTLTSEKKIFPLAFYAFNPLVIIETLVSAHNDGVMAFFGLLGFYLLLKKKPFSSFLSWLFSIGIKYTTAILLPLFAFGFWQKTKSITIDFQKLIQIAMGLMFLAVSVISYRLGFQPWYLLWLLPFIALKAENKFLAWLTISFSLGSLLSYLPFLYYGHWDPPVPTLKLWLTLIPVSLGFLFYMISKYARQ